MKINNNHKNYYYFQPLSIRNIALLLVLFSGLSCSKNSGKEKDYDAPVVQLTSPTDNQVFTAGQNILITGSVTDNKYIKEIHIEVTDLISAQEYLHVHIHPAAAAFNFSQAFLVEAGKQYKIRVIADDPSSNSSIKAIEISTN
jgi:hypothetical protein